MPRNHAHIRLTLAAIESFWWKHPDWRLGQLMVNAAGQSDLFNIEDGTLLIQLCGLDQKLGDKP